MIIAVAAPYKLEVQVGLRHGMKRLGDQTRIGELEELHRVTYVITVSALL